MNKYFPLTVVTVAEATIGIFIKLTGNAINIFSLTFYSVLFALLFLGITIPLIDRSFLNISRKEIKPTLIIGGLIASQLVTFNFAISIVPIANAVILWTTYSFFVFIFSIVFLKEKTTKLHLIVFLIAFLGVFIAKPFSGSYAFGNAVALLDGLIYAVLIAYMRYEDKIETTGIVFWFLVFAAVFLSPMPFIFGFGEWFAFNAYSLAPLLAITVQIPAIVWVLGLGLFSTGVVYLFITFALQKINANIYSLVDIVVSPLIAAFFGFIILGEIPSISLLYGGALLLFAGFLLSSDITRAELSKTHHFYKYFRTVKRRFYRAKAAKKK